MGFRILGKPTKAQPSNYRGTYRITPGYCDELDPDHEVNKLFFWYCSEGSEEGIVYDISKARELVDAYHQLIPSQHFEIVETIKGDQQPITQATFLGYDLSSGSHSLLSWGLKFDFINLVEVSEGDYLYIIRPLITLVSRYFDSQLNKNGLFDDYEIASFCLNCMIAMQKIRPGLWENEEVNFEVLGIWKIL